MNKFGRPWAFRYNRVSLHIERIKGKIEIEKKQERGKEKKREKKTEGEKQFVFCLFAYLCCESSFGLTNNYVVFLHSRVANFER